MIIFVTIFVTIFFLRNRAPELLQKEQKIISMSDNSFVGVASLNQDLLAEEEEENELRGRGTVILTVVSSLLFL